jgi:diguanylate cyclase (GGDEF)-like protein
MSMTDMERTNQHKRASDHGRASQPQAPAIEMLALAGAVDFRPGVYQVNPTLVVRCKQLASWLSLTVLAVATTMLCVQIIPTARQYVWAAGSTGSFMLLSLAAICLRLTVTEDTARPWGRYASKGLALALTSVGAFSLLFYRGTLAGIGAGQGDQGSIAIHLALNVGPAITFVLLGLGLLGLHVRDERSWVWPADIALLLVVAWTLWEMIGSLLCKGTPSESGLLQDPGLLLCLPLLVVSLSTCRAVTGQGVSGVLVSQGLGGQMSRVLLPIVLLPPALQIGNRLVVGAGAVPTSQGLVVVTEALSLILLGGVLWIGARLNRAEWELQEKSLTDDMTGIRNRRGFYELAEQSHREALRHRQACVIAYVDIDGLKAVNDRLGHEVGSAMIRDVANILRSSCRDSDLVGRLGGDEFAIYAKADTAYAEMLGNRLTRNIEAFNETNDRPYRVAMSFGIVGYEPASLESLASLLERADQLMYIKKIEGKKAKLRGGNLHRATSPRTQRQRVGGE